LDAGYCSKNLLKVFFPENTGDKQPDGDVIIRMPARKGYPYEKLYHSKKALFGNGKYLFSVTTYLFRSA